MFKEKYVCLKRSKYAYREESMLMDISEANKVRKTYFQEYENEEGKY